MLSIDVNPYLDKKTEKLFTSLEQLTNIPAGRIIADLASGKANLEDLKDLNEVLKEEKRNPNPKTYTHEEARKFLGLDN